MIVSDLLFNCSSPYTHSSVELSTIFSISLLKFRWHFLNFHSTVLVKSLCLDRVLGITMVIVYLYSVLFFYNCNSHFLTTLKMYVNFIHTSAIQYHNQCNELKYSSIDCFISMVMFDFLFYLKLFFSISCRFNFLDFYLCSKQKTSTNTLTC